MVMWESKKEQRLGQEKYNNENCLMKIIEYKNSKNIIVEFQDKYRTKVHANYDDFLKGRIKNPYYPSVFGAGIIGNKYTRCTNNTMTKEYNIWSTMLQRCFDKKLKEKYPTYKNVTCCDEWLLYDNFYEWLHNQENFEKWFNGEKWAIDKDILFKGNKIYSPETCCLVPPNINTLFIKSDKNRNKLPIGVSKHENKYRACYNNPLTKKYEFIGHYIIPEDAFYLGYKPYKENLIKKIAQIEYDKGNITKVCYEAMLVYEVEITD